MQEKYLENVQASNSSQPSSKTAMFGRPKQELPPVSQMMDLHDRVMGEAIRKVEDKKEAAAANANANANAKKKSFSSIQRTNPTIAAMEIMTRKEIKMGEMEQRLARGELPTIPIPETPVHMKTKVPKQVSP